MAELNAAAEQGDASGPRLISFVVLREDEPVIEQAITMVMAGLTGANRRGRALGIVSREYLGAR